MLKFSRLVLCVLILVTFFYKAVYSSPQTENDMGNGNWKLHPKPEWNLHELLNMHDEDSDSGGHWIKLTNQRREPSSSAELSNEVVPEDLLNVPLNQIDMDKLEKTPWMKYLIIRNEKKRNREFNPRLGRRSIDDCAEVQRSRPPFAPRLGKKSNSNFTPRLGRSVCSDYVDKQ